MGHCFYIYIKQPRSILCLATIYWSFHTDNFMFSALVFLFTITKTHFPKKNFKKSIHVLFDRFVFSITMHMLSVSDYISVTFSWDIISNLCCIH